MPGRKYCPADTRPTGSDTVIAKSPDALLIRPDGYVAWAGEAGGNADRLRDALSRWFGAARNS
ncbi:aromatic-ring hydroxylase C-terminal domain-containing protein [Nocardia sp. R16R-3T]